MKDRIVFRDMFEDDDIAQVASLIYGTDPYIYPYLFNKDEKLGIKVLSNMITSNTLYNYKNIKVGVLDSKIVGIIVWMRAPFKVVHKAMIDAFINANAVVGERFTKTYNEYFKLLENEPGGIYIANVCVDKNARHKGVGEAMLKQFLKDDEEYHLESVVGNDPAYKLYTSMGFKQECIYPGFTEVPCYRMTRERKGK